MKLLHSADWHLDSPLVGRTEKQADYLKQALLKIPDQIVSLCKNEGCDLLILAGDLFDGKPSKESLQAVRSALAEAGVPVVITPGNHDFCSPDSPYLTEVWPENVHIFTRPVMESLTLPALDCKIYGAGYEAMDCPGLLKHFTAEGDEKWHIGVLHADPLQLSTPYAPMTKQQIAQSALNYLALGHIHKGGSFRSGDTLCAWPGCPMGRGYDESGMKGAMLITLDENGSHIEFLPMNTPRFYDEAVDVGESATDAISSLLPPMETQDFYRITLTGYADTLDLPALIKEFSHVPNLELRDRTQPEIDLWSAIGEDTLEGVYFRLLHDGLNTDSEKLQQNLKLAARISRQILDGQEVILP
jgi:DNA repair exonuclease SbcCD nuclease subunit